MKFSTLSQRFLVTFGAAACAFTVALLANLTYAQWQNPAGTPPSNNVAAPINVGSTGQTKYGGLAAHNLLSWGNVEAKISGGVGGNIIAENYVRGGNHMRSPRYCDANGANCITLSGSTAVFAGNISTAGKIDSSSYVWSANGLYTNGGISANGNISTGGDVWANTWVGANYLRANNQMRSNSYCDFNGGNCFSPASVGSSGSFASQVSNVLYTKTCSGSSCWSLACDSGDVTFVPKVWIEESSKYFVGCIDTAAPAH